MPKNKSHKGTLKRIRITATGKVRHLSANRGHFRQRKSAKRLRQLRRDRFMRGPDAKRYEKLLFRRLRGRFQPRSAIRRSPSPEERRQMRAEQSASE